ncbi:MAG TPA: chromate transporter [Sediminispirochaeta sp.]|nr:chromate transporter [Sediminispirochaeta sp.]
MSLLYIFIAFFKIGLFTIGGGLAAIPLLREELVKGGWVTSAEFIDMLAVSQSTPGPIGINMATYAGFKAASFVGSLCATAGMVAPSLIIIVLIARFMRHFDDHPVVQGVLAGIRPAAVGLIAAAAWFVLANSLFILEQFPDGVWLDLRALGLFAVLALLYWRTKAYPVYYIVAGGLAGIFLF